MELTCSTNNDIVEHVNNIQENPSNIFLEYYYIGYEDFHNAIARIDNPYIVNSNEYQSWCEGWDSAYAAFIGF